MSASFLLSLVQRGAGVDADPESRPRARAAIDDTFDILDDTNEEQDDAPVTGASVSAESVAARAPIELVRDADAPRPSDAADVESRASLPGRVEPSTGSAVRERSGEIEKKAVRAAAREGVRLRENDGRSTAAKGPVEATSRAIQVSGPAVRVHETVPNAQRTAIAAPDADAIAPAASVEPIARQVSVEPLAPWMPRADAATDPSWPESDDSARENHVEVRIGRIEIVQPPPAAPVQPPARRKPRGFDSVQAARRYLDRRWY